MFFTNSGSESDLASSRIASALPEALQLAHFGSNGCLLHLLEAAIFALFGIGLLLGCDPDPFPLHPSMVPESIVDLEELRQHRPALLQALLPSPVILRQHYVIIVQYAAAP